MSEKKLAFRDLFEYRNLLFDCDGVLLDSNTLKRRNIREAASPLFSGERLESFLDYFNSNPGIPREVKMKKFIKDEREFRALLHRYNHLNESSLDTVQLVPGVREFLYSIRHSNAKKYVVSGGDREEILTVFRKLDLIRFFDDILGGPRTKAENIGTLDLPGKKLFFGDSIHDLEVSEAFGFDFVFVSGQTDVVLKKSESSIQKFYSIEDFRSIT